MYISRQPEKKPNTVNILGIVPAQDVFWKGNLKEIKRLLEKLGLQVNTLFGEGETLEDIRNAGGASLNIVVSDVFGIEAARRFEDVHGIPYIPPIPHRGRWHLCVFVLRVHQCRHR
jgi:nitrogenase molybdenum-iron protein beta chain